jgi:hypothetical protein
MGDTFLMVMSDKRAYGTGTLSLKDVVWWARWWTRDGRRPNRKLGPARSAGRRDGLTKKQAEQMLRELIASGNAGVRSRGRDDPTIAQLGEALIARLEAQGRKPSHIEGVRCHLRAHIDPVLGELQVGQVDDRDIVRLARDTPLDLRDCSPRSPDRAEPVRPSGGAGITPEPRHPLPDAR